MIDWRKKTMNPGAMDAMKSLELSNLGAIAQAQRILKENAICTSITATEQKRAEEIKRLIDPYDDIRELHRQKIDMQATIESAKRIGGLSNFAGLDLKNYHSLSRSFDQYSDRAKQYEMSFRAPHVDEIAKLMESIQVTHGSAAFYAQQYFDNIGSQLALFKSMSNPWMREIEAQYSATALMELHGLGTMLRTVHGFDEAMTTVLRLDFGDWRDSISFPQIVFDDPVARTEFYVERGFNVALTDFPDKAFQESLVLVRLDSAHDEQIEWPEGMLAVDSSEDAAFERTNKCHNYLQRLERRLRQFIDEAMTAQYGETWPKLRLPPVMLEAWEHKKSRAVNSGVIISMYIEVADFTDYETIICHKEHWRLIFEARFKRKESVRESFQRLLPIRLSTMHARFVTKEDELYVLAESTRLLRALSG